MMNSIVLSQAQITHLATAMKGADKLRVVVESTNLDHTVAVKLNGAVTLVDPTGKTIHFRNDIPL
jgi:hypothetical protein